jgi:hypothetical protein
MGNIYVADDANNEIRKITSAGFVSLLAGGDYYHYGHKDGQGSSALFNTPICIASDSAGNVFVLDGNSNLIRKITPDGNVTTLLGPVEPSITGPFDPFSVGSIAIDKYGNLFFSISVGIIKMTPDGTISRYTFGGYGGTSATDGPLSVATWSGAPAGMAIDQNGAIYVTDGNKVRKIAWQ